MTDRWESSYSQEIAQQPDLFRSFFYQEEGRIQECVKELKAREIKRVICTGCGDAYANAVFGAQCLNDLCGKELKAEAVEPFELLHWATPLPDHTAVIICSVKGRSKLVLEALKAMKGGFLVAITNEQSSPVACQSDRVIELHAGSWIGPRTKVYTLTSYAILVLAALYCGKEEVRDKAIQLGDQIDRILRKQIPWRKLTGACTEQAGVTFVEYGRGYSTAYMGRAKMKEVLRWEANIYQIEEFAHTETVAPAPGRYTIFCCEKSPLLQRVIEVIRVAKEQLSRDVLVICNQEVWEEMRQMGLECAHITIPDVWEAGEAILQSVVIQILPFYIALRLGIDPDHPPLREMARETAFVAKTNEQKE